jgi:hypothetical protein
MADGPVPEHEVRAAARQEGDFDGLPDAPPNPSLMRSTTLREMRARHEQIRRDEERL